MVTSGHAGNFGWSALHLHKMLKQLAMVEGENLVDIPNHWVKPNIHVETDYAFGGMQQKTSDSYSW